MNESAIESPESGACYNCGFLTKHDSLNRHLALFFEFTHDSRDYDRYFQLGDWNLRPWCFRDEPLLDEVLADAGLDAAPGANSSQEERSSTNEAAHRATHRDRTCPLWMQYKHGLGPREHLDELRTRQREDDRRNFELEMERERREYEQRTETARRDFEQTVIDRHEEQELRNRRVGYVLAGAGIFLGVAEVLGSAISIWIALD